VSFALVHAGKYRTEDKPKTDALQKLNTTHKKQTTKNSRTKLAWFSRLFTTLGSIITQANKMTVTVKYTE